MSVMEVKVEVLVETPNFIELGGIHSDFPYNNPNMSVCFAWYRRANKQDEIVWLSLNEIAKRIFGG